MEPAIFASGKVIYDSEDFTGTIYIVCKGVVEVVDADDSENRRMLCPGDTFGLNEVHGTVSLRNETAKALNKVFLLVISQRDFETLNRTAKLN